MRRTIPALVSRIAFIALTAAAAPTLATFTALTGLAPAGALAAQDLAGAPAGGPASAVTVVHAGALFDGTADRLVEDVTILVRDGRIAEVGRDIVVPEGAERIDLSGWTVLPGLIDLHTHITGDHEGLKRPPGLELYTTYPEYPALQGAVNARTTLLAGFTTIRDLGAPGTTTLALRDAIDRGWCPGRAWSPPSGWARPAATALVAVRGNPLRDITLMQDVGFVMKDGVVHKRDGRAVLAAGGG